MFLLSVGSFVFTFLQIFPFGVIGENVTLMMRKNLYGSILRKHIGWFDSQDNTPGVLSAAMASEA
jgi:ATP-binding cassette subfamily B (MDR/TAP) protein 1